MTSSAPLVPEEAPPAPRDTRRELAEEFLRGAGIEIGALHLAMAVPEAAAVRYVDRMTVDDLRAHYPELADLELAPVDIVDDGELLTTFAPESLDFIIANHFLEHCEDPIRTIETHLGKLRSGGVLFYAVPDKRYTFDFRRPRTPLAHVVDDHEHGPILSRHDHYLEWQRLVSEAHLEPMDPGLIARAEAVEADGYSIHFHVWTQADLVELMLHCHERFETFEIEAVRRRSLENIVVLRKHGTPAGKTALPPAADQEPTALDPPPARPSDELRSEVVALLSRLQVHRLLELDCGDFGWMKGIAAHVETYTGVDRDFDTVLRNRIEHGGPRRRFLVRDVIRDPLPGADLVLSRDLLTRLTEEDVPHAIDGILRTRARYLLAALPPLSMPAPVEMLGGAGGLDGRGHPLALWDLDEVRATRSAESEPTGSADNGNRYNGDTSLAEHEMGRDRQAG